MTILVTGGAGFIGSNFILDWFEQGPEPVLNIDKLTYAGNLQNLATVSARKQYFFFRIGIEETNKIRRLLGAHNVRAIINFAAESHVDRSIAGPEAFFQTNVIGTLKLLEAAREYWTSGEAPKDFRFLQVSTDEVYGELGDEGAFTEETPYAPNSPYAATKASSDHLVRAWHRTYGLPTIVSNCSNNYGPFQFPEKLIPLTILNALEGRPLPVYGRGENVRDWLYVGDHVAALDLILREGKIGDTYNIGGGAEMKNIDVVRTICSLMDELSPKPNPHAELITFVTDRPGHDFRYAINADKIDAALGWRPRETFASGLRETVTWYLANRHWWERIRSGVYRGERLGVAAS